MVCRVQSFPVFAQWWLCGDMTCIEVQHRCLERAVLKLDVDGSFTRDLKRTRLGEEKTSKD